MTNNDSELDQAKGFILAQQYINNDLQTNLEKITTEYNSLKEHLPIGLNNLPRQCSSCRLWFGRNDEFYCDATTCRSGQEINIKYCASCFENTPICQQYIKVDKIGQCLRCWGNHIHTVEG